MRSSRAPVPSARTASVGLADEREASAIGGGSALDAGKVIAFMAGQTPLYRAVGVFLLVFGVAGFIDVMVSRIVLDEREIRVISLMRTRKYRRGDFESAKVDGGAVCLKRRDGGWLVLPDTGRNSLAVRNTVHAWLNPSE